jgi:biofilm PGA synthesis lipoprotein PgaB
MSALLRRAAPLALVVLLLGGAAPVALAAAPATPSAAEPAKGFPLVAILCYHDLSTDASAPLQSVSPDFLRAQIRACQADGWTFLPLSELLARREHPERLPAKVMVLTFDDGYRSFATRARPILDAEGVTATLAIITSFVDRPPADLPPLLSWDEIRALDQGGRTEIASHSHALHGYATSNPYGDTAPALATRRYRTDLGRYEDRDEYRSRIGDDLAESQRQLTQHLGHPASVMVWPYGMHNEMARSLAARAGFGVSLTLDWRPASEQDLRSGCLPRIMVTRDMDFRPGSTGWLHPPAAPIRAAFVDLDAVWDPDESAFRDRLDEVVTRTRALGANAVILPVCPDPRRDGRLLRAYAMNHQLPVLADVWSMAAAKFAAARMKVWLEAPAMNLTWAWDAHPEWRLAGSGRGDPAIRWGTRLSPDLAGARRAAVDFFTDLAVYLPIDGVLFDDDARLAPGERLAGDRRHDVARGAEAIRGLIEACKSSVRAWRPGCRFGRSVPAEVAERRGLDPHLAQDFDECLRLDDLTVVTLGSRGGRPSAGAIRKLARTAVGRWRAVHPGEPAGPPPVLLVLPAFDLRAHDWIPASAQQAMAAAALEAGLVDLGTGPIAAAGEMPIGLLDDPARRPAERGVEHRH